MAENIFLQDFVFVNLHQISQALKTALPATAKHTAKSINLMRGPICFKHEATIVKYRFNHKICSIEFI